MRAQQLRTDVMPLTWEIPAAIACSWLLLAVIALPAGQALAALLTGHRIAWPDGDLLRSSWQLLRGLPGAGLARAERAALPPEGVVYAGIAIAELLVAACVLVALRIWWLHGGPGTQWGLAYRHDIEPILGLTNLRKRRHLIRPDLYSPGRRP